MWARPEPPAKEGDTRCLYGLVGVTGPMATDCCMDGSWISSRDRFPPRDTIYSFDSRANTLPDIRKRNEISSTQILLPMPLWTRFLDICRGIKRSKVVSFFSTGEGFARTANVNRPLFLFRKSKSFGIRPSSKSWELESLLSGWWKVVAYWIFMRLYETICYLDPIF